MDSRCPPWPPLGLHADDIHGGRACCGHGAAGIGRALAHAFATAGHPCLLISRHLEAHPELEDQPVLYRQLDVGDADELGPQSGTQKASTDRQVALLIMLG